MRSNGRGFRAMTLWTIRCGCTCSSGLQPGKLPAAGGAAASVRHWTLTTLREKLIKIGAKVVRHSRKVVFQMAEVAVPRELFRSILQAIESLRLPASASG